jgi:ABC-type sugar transport system ATPase subunit
LIGGVPASVATPRQAQERGIAIVAQELSLCPDLSVEDNIWLGSLRVPFLHALRVPFLHKRPELRRRAAETLALLGAAHIGLDTPVAKLAMGERQLVEIARLLTRDARILILDEPTATLCHFQIECVEAFGELSSQDLACLPTCDRKRKLEMLFRLSRVSLR